MRVTHQPTHRQESIMSEALSTRPSRRGWQHLLQWSALAAAASAIVACGGGGDTNLAGGGGVGAGGTGITGMVNGFGSVIVGGVRYDDSSATVTREDASDDSKLRLGMTVDVSVDDSCAVAATSCVARGFEVHSDLAGEITADTLNAQGIGTITVMGQTVDVNTGTFVHRSSGVANTLSTGSRAIVKVHGRRAAAGAATGWVATYIEIKADTDAGLAGLNRGFQFRVAGALTGSNGSYQIGGEPVDLSGVTLPSGSNVYVRAKITPAASRPGSGWVVTELKSRKELVLALRSRARVEVQGYVQSATVGTNSTLIVIDGREVVVAPTITFDNGITYATLGTTIAVVEVKGTVNVDGQLVATKIEVSDEAEREFHVRPVEVSAVTSTTFVVTKSNTDPVTVEFDSGDFTAGASAADLGVRILEIKGNIDRATGRLIATRIKRDD
jgi:hypothetical protein